MSPTEIITFTNTSKEDHSLVKQFVRFHWDFYRDDTRYVPLLNFEYLGSRLLGMVGFFEERNLFFRHGEIVFFLAVRDGKIVGRNCAFTNRRHNEHWQDKTGFFGQFECENNSDTARLLTDAAESWLKERGIDTVRGPQSFPVNEATPGVMIDGFNSRPIIYYPFNREYYHDLLKECGYGDRQKIFSWEVPVMSPIEDKLRRVGEIVQKREHITLESWNQRPLPVRKKEMLEIYNEAWWDNFGFVPFTAEEFSEMIDEMKPVIDKNLFIFAYVRGEPAAFFGGVPNIFEKMKPEGLARRWEFFRAAKMFLGAGRTRGFRLGYLGVKKKYRGLGLEGFLLYHQKQHAQKRGYEYTDIGWILEENEPTIRLVRMMQDNKLSKTYMVMEKEIR